MRFVRSGSSCRTWRRAAPEGERLAKGGGRSCAPTWGDSAAMCCEPRAKHPRKQASSARRRGSEAAAEMRQHLRRAELVNQRSFRKARRSDLSCAVMMSGGSPSMLQSVAIAKNVA